MSALRLGALAYPVTAPADFAAFADKMHRLVAEGAAGGGQMLVLPEYACMELAATSPGAGDAARELDAVCAQHDALMVLFKDAARANDVWLLPGSLPFRQGAEPSTTPR